MNRISIISTALLCISATLASCGSKGYKVEGNVTDADPDSFITLERADPNGGWLILDSISLASGKFSFQGESTGVPEIYRLRYNGQYIYLPVDSTETLTVNTSASKFATDFILTGSDNARQMEAFEKKLIAFSPNASNPDSLRDFKRRVYTEFLKDAHGSVVSYYILTKTIGNKALYDHSDDYKYFAAVATSFRQFRPDDPRTALLEKVASEGMRKHNKENGKQKVVEAEELAFIDLELPDETGKPRKISELASKGKPVVIVFANMTESATPKLNMDLRGLLPKVDLYHVSFDPDQYSWREAASNLPWTTVWAGDVTNGSQTALSYNIQNLPVFFIIDSSGHLTDRAESYEDLKKKI